MTLAAKPPTDKNDFDDTLKAKLHRDIIFRMVFWTVLSFSSGYFAIAGTGSTALEFLLRISHSTMPLINTFGVAALLFCVLAMALKDIEVTSRNPKVIAATKGMVGGFVRRGAGDLSLWALGVINAMICAVVLVFLFETLSERDKAAGHGLLFLLLVLFFFLAVANVWVRRNDPSPIVKDSNLPAWAVFLIWGSIGAVLGAVLLWNVLS